MLKKIKKVACNQLLKVSLVKRAVADYKRRQQKQKDDQLFARCMCANQSIRLIKSDVLTVVGEGGKFEERLGGRVVETGWIDSNNWGRVY